MAPKRPTQDLPPSSETESEDSSSTDASDSQPQSQPQETHQDSDSDSTDSDDTLENTQKGQNPSSLVTQFTQLKANGKRPAETDKGSKSKKIKGVEKVEKGSKNSVPFARLFSEKDEIFLLEGMIEYKEKNGSDPTLDSFAFHDSIKDLLSCSVTKYQTADKMRRLKKKFWNNVKRGHNGQDPVISRPHEYKSFELSKKIWGGEVEGNKVDGDGKASTSSRRRNKKGDDGGSKTPVKSVENKESDNDEEVMDRNEVETEDVWSLYPSLCASLESEVIKNLKGPVTSKGFVKKVVKGLEIEKARALEKKWEDFTVMEQQVYAKRVKLISEQAEVVMNVLKP